MFEHSTPLTPRPASILVPMPLSFPITAGANSTQRKPQSMRCRPFAMRLARTFRYSPMAAFATVSISHATWHWVLISFCSDAPSCLHSVPLAATVAHTR